MTADAVTVTHDHADHNNVAAVTAATLVDGRRATTRQELMVKSNPFVLIPGFHDNTNGSQRGPNTMVRWTQGGLRFAHLGDLGQEQLTDAQKADLTGIDVLFLPAGGFFTISPERAAQYVRELRPRVAILMHYRTALAGPAQTAALPDAAAPFSPVQYKPATVTLQKETLPETTETWVMLPASDATAVNAASFVEAAPVAPGSVVSIFGKFGGTAASATRFPLATKLGDTEVLIDGRAAPLYYVSPEQVNAQVPAATRVGQVVTEVRVGGQPVGRAPTNVLANAPGLFGAVPNPVKRGGVLSIYGTGIGAVTPAVEDGAAAGASVGTAMPNVFLMNRQLAVEYSGLAPGFAGLWQLNVRLPADAPTGPDLPVYVVSGTTSNLIKVTVQQ